MEYQYILPVVKNISDLQFTSDSLELRISQNWKSQKVYPKSKLILRSSDSAHLDHALHKSTLTKPAKSALAPRSQLEKSTLP